MSSNSAPKGLSGGTLATIAIIVAVIIVIVAVVVGISTSKSTATTAVPPINTPPVTPPIKTMAFTAVPIKQVAAKPAEAIFTIAASKVPPAKEKDTVHESKYAVTIETNAPAVSNMELATAYNNSYAFMLNDAQSILNRVFTAIKPFSYSTTMQLGNPACAVSFAFTEAKEIAQIQVYHVNISSLRDKRLLFFLTVGWPQLTIPVTYTSTCGIQGTSTINIPNVQINMSFLATGTPMCAQSSITLSGFALNYVDLLSDLPANYTIHITAGPMGGNITVPVEIIPPLQAYIGDIAKELNNVPSQTLHLVGNINACDIITSLLMDDNSTYIVKPPRGFFFNSDLGPPPTGSSTDVKGAPACFTSCKQGNTCAAALSNGSQCILYPYSADGSTPFIPQIVSNDRTPVMSQWLYNGRGFLPTRTTSIMVLADGKYSLDFSYDYVKQVITSSANGSNGGQQESWLTVDVDRKTVSWKNVADPVYSRGWIITSRYGLPVVLSTSNSSATQQSTCTVEFNGIAISLFGRLHLGAGFMTLSIDGSGEPSTIYVRND